MNATQAALVRESISYARTHRLSGDSPAKVARYLERTSAIRRSLSLYGAQIAAGNWSTLWVCRCCLLVAANGECGDDYHDTEPLSLIPDAADISVGLFADEHADTCTEDDRSEGHCSCEERTFSWDSCEGCGSNLGGDRHAMTIVYDMRGNE